MSAKIVTSNMSHSTMPHTDFLMDIPLVDNKPDVSFTEYVEDFRLTANTQLDNNRRGELGQYMTPPPVARLMASMFDNLSGDIRLLDAGAGVGSLTAAFVEEACRRNKKLSSVTAHAYELDSLLARYLHHSMKLCDTVCQHQDVAFSSNIYQDDFISQAVSLLQNGSLDKPIKPSFNYAILNPPYYKINTDSDTRKQLSSVGIETVNLYAAFVALAIKLLDNNGELVAITPRSFCNGPYYKPFRQLLLDNMTLKQIHIFDSRKKAFKGDDVLQENIIFHAVKRKTNTKVLISSSTCADDKNIRKRRVYQKEISNPNDSDLFIHIVTSEDDNKIATQARSLPCSLKDLGIQVSTGRVVDFRATEYLKMKPSRSTVPLIYPRNFEGGFIAWPKLNSDKHSAIKHCKGSAGLMVPSDIYVLTKRFTSKEEKRRVVAAIYDPKLINSTHVGFENHLNYFHINGTGLSMGIAKGLALFLNSSLVDRYFRQFNGHTQVNATDLRSLRYPSLEQLKLMGKRFRSRIPDQARIDTIIEQVLF